MSGMAHYQVEICVDIIIIRSVLAMSNKLHFLLVAYPVYLTKQLQQILHGTAGAIIAANANMNGLIGIMTCWVGLFAPGILLIYGLLPWWARFRQLDIYRRYVACLSSFATYKFSTYSVCVCIHMKTCS